MVVLAGITVSLRADEPTRRTITPEDMVNIRAVDDPKITPDGKFIAFTVTEPADTNRPGSPGNADIWIVATDGKSSPRRFAFGPKQESTPRWSPDGKYLAFLSNRGQDDKTQVYIMPVSGGEADALTSMKEGVSLFQWNPDSRGVSILSSDTLTSAEATKLEMKDDEKVLDENNRHSRLYSVDLATRSITLLTKEDETVNGFDYSPDGLQIALAVSPSPSMDDVYYRPRLVIMNRDGSGRKTISDRCFGNIRWSPDGRQILHFCYKGKAGHLFPELVSPAGVRTSPLKEDYYGAVFEMEWNPGRPEILVSSQEGVQGIIGRLDYLTGKVDRLRSVGRPYTSYTNLSIDAGGASIAFVDASTSSPLDIWIMKADGTGARRLTDLNQYVTSLVFSPAERVQWTARDGEPIDGILVRPAEYRSGKSYPLVVLAHGGPAWGWWLGWSLDWYNWSQLLAGNGFAVLMPNPRGSACCGWKFADKNVEDWGGGDFNDIMDGVDYLIQHGIADSNRLGIGGWSYGGYMTEWAVTQTKRFKAAVSVSGLSNLTSFYGTVDIPTFMQWSLGGGLLERESLYVERSPLTFIENVRTPTLLLHGEADIRVPVSQSYEFYRGLKDMGIESRFVVYPREPHAIGERAHQLDLLERMLDWYSEHLRE
ncbi:hypothetical protein C3F09_05570 [candidate division GN15 bacterium]|uniref:Peptidase S9 prolyl oligopeptidase catalytic domain-containing protein n=1 Tax=candidate division GN15 bacterium TaxID=2072418 RepID=A0A855X819_9BACT|nr:MAG: hypothetical protein C3F09_05570 [candidate division GN15 bacterium]